MSDEFEFDSDSMEMEFEDDFEMGRIRERRMEELKKQVQKMEEMRANKHGEYLEIQTEKEALSITTSERFCLVHFFHKEFKRCKIMDKHLKELASKHFKTKFVKINVENAPFLVTRLGVQVLPCVIVFIDGVGVDRLIGFEDFGNSDSFETLALEKRLIASGAIQIQEKKNFKILSGTTRTKSSAGRDISSDDEY